MNQRINSIEARTNREVVPYLESRGTASHFALALFLSICGLLTACAEATESTPSSAVAGGLLSGVEIAGPDPAANRQNPATGTYDPAVPQTGGVLLIEVDECGIADPAVDVASSKPHHFFTLVKETHAGLTRIADDPAMRAEPELAQSFTVHDNGSQFDFTLRKDLKFSDGSPLTASDVKWSWERALRKSTINSRVNDVLGDVIGAEEVALGHSQDLTGVTVVDQSHLIVRLRASRPEFPILISDPVAYVLKRENIDDWDEAWVNDPAYPGEITNITGVIPDSLPIGAGPFKIAEYTHSEITRDGFSGEARCVLERNDHFWGRPSYLDAVIANVRPDLLWDLEAGLDRQKELLGNGELDIAMTRSTDLDDVPDGIKLLRANEPPRVEFLTLNPAQQPLDDVNLRRALAKAIDLNTAIRIVNGALNQNRLVPQSVSINGSDVSALDLDLASAKNEIDMSLQGSSIEPLNITLYSISPPEFEFAGVYRTAIFDVWRDALGVNVDIQQFDFDNPIRFEELHMTKVSLDLYYPSPHGVMREFLNAMGENNAAPTIIEMRDQLSTAAATLDDVERLRRYEDIERQMLDEVLVIPLVVLEPHFDLLLHARVDGLALAQYRNSVFHDVWLQNDPPDTISP